MKATFYGVRGAIPVSSPDCSGYGGNTSCIEFRSENVNILIVDAGTGIRRLGMSLPEEGTCGLILTHAHWDHVQGLPFFAPLYKRGWTVNIHVPHGCGNALERLMDGVGFPVRPSDLPATVFVSEYQRGERLCAAGIEIQTFAVPHPGGCSALRFTLDNRVIALSGDCELQLAPEDRPRQTGKMLKELLSNADHAIVDGQFTAAESMARPGWGHSSVEAWLAEAGNNGVKKLIYTHHDPDRTDIQIDDHRAALRGFVHVLKLGIEPASEGLILE